MHFRNGEPGNSSLTREKPDFYYYLLADRSSRYPPALNNTRTEPTKNSPAVYMLGRAPRSDQQESPTLSLAISRQIRPKDSVGEVDGKASACRQAGKGRFDSSGKRIARHGLLTLTSDPCRPPPRLEAPAPLLQPGLAIGKKSRYRPRPLTRPHFAG